MCLMFYGMIRKDSWKPHPQPVDSDCDERTTERTQSQKVTKKTRR